MPIATCQKVVYKEGSANLTQGVKNSDRNYYDSERSLEKLGNGWGLEKFHSHLWLYTDQGKFDVISFFRSKFKRPGARYALLTEPRRNRIIVAMPKTINLISGPDNKLMPDPIDLEKWFASL